MRRLALALTWVVALTACSSTEASTAGLVTDIETLGLGRVQAFTLRTQEGATLTFDVTEGTDLDSGGFPADHLREHMTTGSGVAVVYREEGDRLVAVRLADATWISR